MQIVQAGEKIFDEATPLELVSKQYLSGKDIRIKSIRELRQITEDPEVGGSTLEVTYDLEGTGMTYKTATNLALFPKNSEADVRKCAELLGYDLDSTIVFASNPSFASKRATAAKHPFPTPCTV